MKTRYMLPNHFISKLFKLFRIGFRYYKKKKRTHRVGYVMWSVVRREVKVSENSGVRFE